ncbi:MAG: NAD-binding protein [Peptoniphilus sp.]|nr:NAD-binding protein [Peptoniphilus sp.]MDD7363452.1 NAD-binding protein [Bacillota bacterium]MDY6044844.1 NAD-binding protein [Peptoniphilus sp.]
MMKTTCRHVRRMRALCFNVRELVHRDHYDDGMALIRDAMKEDPNSPEPHNLLGIILEKSGDHAGAMKHFRAAYALDPSYKPASHNLKTCGEFFSSGSFAYDDGDLEETGEGYTPRHLYPRDPSPEKEAREVEPTRKSDDYTIIIGCGRLGSNLAQSLSDQNKKVVILDQSKSSFDKLSPNFGGLTVVANGTDLDKLAEIHMEEASAVVVVTDSDNTNIMIAQIARDLFHVERVLARLYDPEREMVYKNLFIKTICPSSLSAMEIEHYLYHESKGGYR